MRQGVYSVNELRDMIAPIAAEHGVERVYLFGSYARGDADAESDIDLRIDKGRLRNFFELGGLYADLEERLGKALDLLTTNSLDTAFLKRIAKEEILLYDSRRS